MKYSPTRNADMDALLLSNRPDASSSLAVHLVPNGVRGDSRVIKSAQVSQDLGHASVVIGITALNEPEAFEAEGVPVILVPFRKPTSQASAEEFRRELLKRWGVRSREILLRAGVRTTSNLRAGGTGIRSTLRNTNVLPKESPWSEARPNTLEIAVAFADVLDALRPTIVHAHDSFPLPAAVAYRARAAMRRWRTPHTIYDSHECVPELVKSFPKSQLFRSLLEIEASYIHSCDTVLTVSDEIAAVLQKRYKLGTTPTVVTNGPSKVRDTSAPSLRETIGLEPDVPLAVYSGWVDDERGLPTAVRAVASVPDVHLVVVVNKPSAPLTRTLRLARRLKISDRVHTAPYVPPGQVTEYLSSATVGLIPRGSGGHLDLSLPTKFREYAHAGLPVLVSRNKKMAEEVAQTGAGLAFNPGSVSELASQLKTILADPASYAAKLTEPLLEEYSWESQAKQLAAVYGPASSASAFELGRYEVPADTDIEARPSTWAHRSSQLFHAYVGIGRANTASQAIAWARALRDELGVQAQSFAAANAMRARPDRVVRPTLNMNQGAAELAHIAQTYTYLLVEGFQPMFGPLFFGNVEKEVATLRPHLFGIGLVAHGTEIRDPDRHAREIEGSFYAEVVDEEWIRPRRVLSQRNRDIAARHQGPVFVSTPDLIDDVPDAIWLPVAIDVGAWSAVPAAPLGSKLRVLHQPSRSEPPIKGTDVIDPVLTKLHEEGLIDYIQNAGEVSHNEMLDLVAHADVVVDQIRIGSYGVAACEAMAAGRIVVGAVAASVRDHIPADVPIIDGPPEKFEAAMRELCARDRNELTELTIESAEYVREWHDGRKSAQIIADNLLTL